MYQAATRVNVLSPVITSIAEVDALHKSGRQHHCDRNRRGCSESAGVEGSGMIQDGADVNLGDPLSSSSAGSMEYIETSQQRQGSMDGSVEVGLTDSTQGVGEPRTWGSGQQWRGGFSTCLSDTQRSG
jgi:hypothetical protein